MCNDLKLFYYYKESNFYSAICSDLRDCVLDDSQFGGKLKKLLLVRNLLKTKNQTLQDCNVIKNVIKDLIKTFLTQDLLQRYGITFLL